MSTEEDPIARSDQLDEKIAQSGGFEGVVARMALSIDRGRRALTWIAISLVLDIVLSVVVGVLAWQAHEIAKIAQQASTKAELSCVAGNEARAAEKALWTFILSLPPDKPLTKQQEQERQSFKDYMDKSLAPQDCSHV